MLSRRETGLLIPSISHVYLLDQGAGARERFLRRPVERAGFAVLHEILNRVLSGFSKAEAFVEPDRALIHYIHV
jgi:hypothetical protein